MSTAWTSTSITFDEPVNDYLRVKDKETNLTGIYFKPDGTRLYITGTSADKVQEYSLSDPWIVSSANWVRDFSISAKEAVPWGLYFKDDGSKMFICGSNSDSVHEYGLSTDWDISTATFTTTLDVSGKDTLPAGIFFKPDGTKLYVAGRSSDSVHQYNLTTAWDLSTASFGQSFTDTIRLANIYTVFFKYDGTKMYNINSTTLYEWDLSTAWDISTATVTHGGWGYGSFCDQPRGLYIKGDGTKMWVADKTWDHIFGFTLNP